MALVIAVLSATGQLERLVNRVRARRAVPAGVGDGTDAQPVEAAEDEVPGLSKLPAGMQAALRGEAPWAAALLGLINGFPTPYYLAAMAAALTSGAALAEQMAALVVFEPGRFPGRADPDHQLLVSPRKPPGQVSIFFCDCMPGWGATIAWWWP